MRSVGLVFAILIFKFKMVISTDATSTTPAMSPRTTTTATTRSTVAENGAETKPNKNIPATYTMSDNYDKNTRPKHPLDDLTDVSISLYINRISGVDETKEEISFDVFIQIIWEDRRIKPKTDYINKSNSKRYIELTNQERHEIWVPDLYVRQLREMKVLSLLEEISSLRLYENSTISLSIGATIIIKCDMDFVLYPLDVQKCPVDFSSYKYSTSEMQFRWKKENNLTFPNDSSETFFRLPRYVISFKTNESQRVNYGDEDHYSARLDITLSREIKSYLLENYLPSMLFVIISWGSFVVVPEIVPGRMVLLVTTLLSLVTMFDTVRNKAPDALELKSIEVWLISCTLFVFLALMEYFIVLFGIRYDKHWRSASTAVQNQMPTPIMTIPPTPTPTHQAAPMLTATSATEHSQRKNGIENAARLFTSVNKIQPEDGSKEMSSLQEDGSGFTPQNSTNRRRFRNAAEVAVLYAGSQRGKLDQISLILFPISFLAFTIIYWTYYYSESRKKM